MRRERIWVEIDLDAVRRNFERVRSMLGNERRIMVVLKADAYGHGAVAVARVVSEAGADMIGVGDSTEAIELRQAGVRIPILITGAIVDGEVEAVVRYRITTTIHSHDRLRVLAAEAHRQGHRTPVHLMIDTGMGRLGVSPVRAAELLRAIHHEPSLDLQGIATHFSDPTDEPFTINQLDQFRAVLGQAGRLGLPVGSRHAAATSALWRYPDTHFDMVRPGILVLGIDPSDLGIRERGFEPSLSLRSQIIYLKDVPAGTPIGYGRTHVTSRPTRIATLPVGYNDGLPIAASNRSKVLIDGHTAPLVGRVSMDYVTVDVGHLPQATVGQEVTLIGHDGAAEVRLEELARESGMIVYDLLCGLGKRIRRLYSGERPARERETTQQQPARFDFETKVC